MTFAGDIRALKEVETDWLMQRLSDAISNLPYPVGCGIAPDEARLRNAADMLFERYASMIEMAAQKGQKP